MLPAHGRCYYDSDEISVVNMKLFSGNVDGSKATALGKTVSEAVSSAAGMGNAAPTLAMPAASRAATKSTTPPASAAAAAPEAGAGTGTAGSQVSSEAEDEGIPKLVGLPEITVDQVWAELNTALKSKTVQYGIGTNTLYCVVVCCMV